MSRTHSLFLQHLKQGAVILFESNSVLSLILRDLGTFREYGNELEIYTSILKKIRDCSVPNEFDLHLLQMVVRNVCILTSYHDGSPKFGRADAYWDVSSKYNCS